MGTWVSIILVALKTMSANCPVLPQIPEISWPGEQREMGRATGSGPTKAVARTFGTLTVGLSTRILVNGRVFKSALRPRLFYESLGAGMW